LKTKLALRTSVLKCFIAMLSFTYYADSFAAFAHLLR